MRTPFNFGKTVRNEFFTNRENEIRRLSSNFENGINTIIISPRRWGKSSLVEKVSSQIKSRSLRVVSIDLFSMRTEEEFYSRLANAVIKATSGKAEEWMEMAKKFLRTITPRFTVELGDKQSFNMELDLEATRKHYRELLDLPEKIAREKGLKLVICIDEFQNLSAYANTVALQKRLRSAWQNHEHVTYCLYGSKQHMMMELFNKQNNPFYRFGELMYLPRISESKWVTFITRQFQRTGKKINAEAARTISRSVQCHPYYVQQLSHLVWINTTELVTEQIIRLCVRELVEQNAILYFREAENLNNTELKLLRAIASKEEQLSSRQTIQKYGLGTSAGVVKAKKTLIGKELIDENEGIVSFLDPCFELWFREHLMPYN